MLVAPPRAECCKKCQMTHRPLRLGTGRKDVGNTRGYRMIYVKRRRIYEHRYVMETHIGRRLDRNEHVHHIDFNKINNDINNLELLSASEHGLINARFTNLKRLAKINELSVHKHDGFWYSVDTYKELNDLNEIWKSKNPPWKIWE